MAKHQLFHEFVGGKLIPYWYVIQFDKGEIDWNKFVMYEHFQTPIEYSNRDNFDHDKLSIPVKLNDLVFNVSDSKKIGFNLKNIKLKIDPHGLSYNLFQQIIIPSSEINEFLKLVPKLGNKYYLLKH